MEANGFKVGFSLVAMALSLGVGYVPLSVGSFSMNVITNIGNLFSAGLFISIALIDLIPGAIDLVSDDTSIKFPFLIAIIGYALVLCLDVLVISRLEIDENRAEDYGEERYEQKAIRNKYSKLPLVFALSVHSIMESVAIGIQNSLDSAVHIALAVLIHKIPTSFALGINMKDLPRNRAVVYLCIFSITSPIGILLGMLLSFFNNDVLIGVTDSLCAGIFLYVSCTELIVKSFATSEYRTLNYLFFLLGLCYYIGMDHLFDKYLNEYS